MCGLSTRNGGIRSSTSIFVYLIILLVSLCQLWSETERASKSGVVFAKKQSGGSENCSQTVFRCLWRCKYFDRFLSHM